MTAKKEPHSCMAKVPPGRHGLFMRELGETLVVATRHGVCSVVYVSRPESADFTRCEALRRVAELVASGELS